MTVETPSCAGRSVSLGSCSPSARSPSATDSVMRWITASVRPPEISGAKTVVRAETHPSVMRLPRMMSSV